MPPPVPSPDVLRACLAATDPEGALRILHLNSTGAVVHVTQVAEGAHSADQLFARYVAGLVTDIGSAAAVLLVSRGQGRPRRTDRTLWQAVSARVPSRLLDLVVAGADRQWSAVSDARRTAARKGPSRAGAG